MALSELDMMNLWAKQLTGYKSQWERLFGFGYAVEAEVRKRDEALIRQLVEALEDFDDAGPLGEGWKSAPLLSLLASARARLEGKA